ncbi:MAG: ECF-type sigma factor [Bryobacteraceae bacterium]
MGETFRALVGVKTQAGELGLEPALRELAAVDPRRGRVAAMRYLGGWTEKEIAARLGVSERTVRRDLIVAQVWLYRYANNSRTSSLPMMVVAEKGST